MKNNEIVKIRNSVKVLYHFTTLSNFRLIIDGKKLKFGELENSNDPKEGIYQKNIVYIECNLISLYSFLKGGRKIV